MSFGASVVALSNVIHKCFLKHWRFPLLLAVSAITDGNKEEEEEEKEEEEEEEEEEQKQQQQLEVKCVF